MAVPMQDIPTVIADDEPLIRAVSCPSGLDEEHRATIMAFCLREKKREKALSLLRSLYYNISLFLQDTLSIDFTFLSPVDKPAGVVELLAAEVRTLGEHIVLNASPSKRYPAHASIRFKLKDGTLFVAGRNKTKEPMETEILGYQAALAAIVSIVYDLNGKVIWRREISSLD